jgi:hypothetical protein
MSIHHQAVRHLDLALTFQARGDYDSLRYAALELRHAIECLVYELMPHYKDELPSEAFETWRPQEILEALVDCNPALKHTVVVRISPEDAQGNPTEWHTMGRQTGIGPKLLRAGYHRLGNFLHAPLDGVHDQEKLKRSIQKVIALLEPYRSDNLITTYGMHHNFTCKCGRRVVRREEAIKRSPLVRCPERKCGAQYKYVSSDSGNSEFRIVRRDIHCHACGSTNYLDADLVENGVKIRCFNCEKVWQLHEGFVIVAVADDSTKHDSASAG